MLDAAVPVAKNWTGKPRAPARRRRVCAAGRASPFSNWLIAAEVSSACPASAVWVSPADSRARPQPAGGKQRADRRGVLLLCRRGRCYSKGGIAH